MRQLLLNDRGVLVARAPKPVVDRYSVLVQVKYSMVSVGTELAGLKANLTSTTSTVSPLTSPPQAIRYIGKAIRHPHAAVRKFKKMWAQGKQIIPEIINNITLESSELKWQKAAAWDFQANGEKIQLHTDDSECGYQAMSLPFTIPQNHSPMVELQGTIETGKISIGLLNDDQSQWLGSKTLDNTRINERVVFIPKGAKSATLVIANAQGGSSRVAIDSIKISFLPNETNGISQNELDDTGWNIGYSAVGEVIEVGTAIQDLRPGDVVACAGAGKANHADYIVVPRSLVCKVPLECDLKAASSTTIGTIALQGVRRADPKIGERIAVIGLGLLGQITVQLLRANGCQVIGMDLSENRVTRAKSQGLIAGANSAETFKQLVKDFTEAQGVDRTLITAATSSNAVANLAMEITRRKGCVIIVGDIGLQLERAQFYRKEIDLLMSTSYGPGRYDNNYEEKGVDYPFAYVRWTLNRNMQAYLNLIKNNQININVLIDRVCPIQNAPGLYQELAANAEPPLGVVLEYSEDTRNLPEPADATWIKPRAHRNRQTDRINYVLVGAGAFGTSMLVPQMEKCRDKFFLRGVVSRDAVRAGNYVRQQGLELLASDLNVVLADPSIELLVIATRHCEHATQVIAGLRAGKHIFVEKPLALSWNELDEINRVYTDLNESPLLQVGFNRRFSPAMQKLKETLKDRRSPLMINYRLNGGYIVLDHWIQTEQGGGRNLGEACHMYDCFRFLADAPIKSIQAKAINPGNLPYLPSDNFMATLSYEDGSIATLTYTALGPKQGLPKERIEVFCDGEAYILDDYKLLTRASDGQTLWSGETDKGHFTELEQLGLAINNNLPAPIPYQEIIETTAVSLYIEDLLHERVRDEENNA